MNTLKKLALTTALCLTAAPAFAQSAGDMTLGLGIASVMPKSGNGAALGSVIDVEDNAQPTITFEYFIRDNIGIEILAATPFDHDVKLGGTVIGSTKHLPPTISLNYHFPMTGALKPYVGVGVNYTTFFEEETVGLGGASLTLDDSWGLAVQAGLDYAISDSGSLRLNVRYIDIDTDGVISGIGSIGTVEIDPVVVGVAYVHKF